MEQTAVRRIEELESRLTFQEEHIQALERSLVEQQTSIDALQQQLRELRQQVRQLSPSEVGALSEEPPPPHY